MYLNRYSFMMVENPLLSVMQMYLRDHLPLIKEERIWGKRIKKNEKLEKNQKRKKKWKEEGKQERKLRKKKKKE